MIFLTYTHSILNIVSMVAHDDDILHSVNNNGNVGIGTTDPQAKLDVNGNANIIGKYSQVVPSADNGNQVFTQTNALYRRSNESHHIDTYYHGTAGSGGRRLYLNYLFNSDVSVWWYKWR